MQSRSTSPAPCADSDSQPEIDMQDEVAQENKQGGLSVDNGLWPEIMKDADREEIVPDKLGKASSLC